MRARKKSTHCCNITRIGGFNGIFIPLNNTSSICCSFHVYTLVWMKKTTTSISINSSQAYPLTHPLHSVLFQSHFIRLLFVYVFFFFFLLIFFRSYSVLLALFKFCQRDSWEQNDCFSWTLYAATNNQRYTHVNTFELKNEEKKTELKEKCTHTLTFLYIQSNIQSRDGFLF